MARSTCLLLNFVKAFFINDEFFKPQFRWNRSTPLIQNLLCYPSPPPSPAPLSTLVQVNKWVMLSFSNSWANVQFLLKEFFFLLSGFFCSSFAEREKRRRKGGTKKLTPFLFFLSKNETKNRRSSGMHTVTSTTGSRAWSREREPGNWERERTRNCFFFNSC